MSEVHEGVVVKLGDLVRHWHADFETQKIGVGNKRGQRSQGVEKESQPGPNPLGRFDFLVNHDLCLLFDFGICT